MLGAITITLLGISIYFNIFLPDWLNPNSVPALSPMLSNSSINDGIINSSSLWFDKSFSLFTSIVNPTCSQGTISDSPMHIASAYAFIGIPWYVLSGNLSILSINCLANAM